MNDMKPDRSVSDPNADTAFEHEDKRTPTLRELAEKHGMDFNGAADQQEQFALATGERFTAE